jgi:hypothetical protein
VKLSHSKQKSVRYYHKRAKVFINNALYSYQTVTKVVFSQQIFDKYPNFKLLKIRPVVAQLFRANEQTDGRTDSHGEATSRFSQILERP